MRRSACPRGISRIFAPPGRHSMDARRRQGRGCHPARGCRIPGSAAGSRRGAPTRLMAAQRPQAAGLGSVLTASLQSSTALPRASSTEGPGTCIPTAIGYTVRQLESPPHARGESNENEVSEDMVNSGLFPWFVPCIRRPRVPCRSVRRTRRRDGICVPSDPYRVDVARRRRSEGRMGHGGGAA